MMMMVMVMVMMMRPEKLSDVDLGCYVWLSSGHFRLRVHEKAKASRLYDLQGKGHWTTEAESRGAHADIDGTMYTRSSRICQKFCRKAAPGEGGA
jgi:hypothetical protein